MTMGDGNPPAAILMKMIGEPQQENHNLRKQAERPARRFGFGI
jgi:hypothetical protein